MKAGLEEDKKLLKERRAHQEDLEKLDRTRVWKLLFLYSSSCCVIVVVVVDVSVVVVVVLGVVV